MAINDKMWHGMREEQIDCYDGSSKACAQAVINSAWTKFDAEDESTWPKTARTPNNNQWILIDSSLNMTFGSFIVPDAHQQSRDVGWWFGILEGMEITHYADPELFKPQESE